MLESARAVRRLEHWRAAAALGGAAALLLAAAACAGDDSTDDTSSSPSDAATVSPGATENPQETPGGQSGGGTDATIESAVFTVFGRATDDLLSGSTNVALGDFNDDGDPDLLLGAPQADSAGGERVDGGEAYVIFGPLEGEVDLLDQEPDITIYGASAGDALGFTVFAGDLNDDGVDEVMVGAPGVTAGFDPRTDQGRLYVFYGGEDLEDAGELDLAEDMYDLTVTGSEGFSRLSTDVDLGDINGDGRTDLLVSSPFAGRAPGTPPGSQRTAEGEVYVIFGSDEELMGERNIAAGDYDVLLGGTQEFGQFGGGFGVGDFNGDGFDDVVVGAHRNNADDGRPSAGEAFVFFGRDDISGRISALENAQDVRISGVTAGSAFGLPVTAGDFNGDGLDDFAIGARSEGIVNLATAGSVRIFYGRQTFPAQIDLSAEPGDVTLPGSGAGGLLPSALTAGDTNGDGIDDVILSAALGGAGVGRSSAGLVYIVPGSAGLPSEIELDGGGLPEPIVGPSENAGLGTALWFGPIDGEGTNGLAALATGLSPDEERTNAGAVFVLPLGGE